MNSNFISLSLSGFCVPSIVSFYIVVCLCELKLQVFLVIYGSFLFFCSVVEMSLSCVLVFECCHNKIPPTESLKKGSIFCFIVMEARNKKSSYWQGHFPPENWKGKSFVAISSFWQLLASLGIFWFIDTSVQSLLLLSHGCVLSHFVSSSLLQKTLSCHIGLKPTLMLCPILIHLQGPYFK